MEREQLPLALFCVTMLGFASTALADAGRVPVTAVEFVGMDAPVTPEQRAVAYSAARVRVTVVDGTTGDYPLRYRLLHDVNDRFGDVTVGDLYDSRGNVLIDLNGKPRRSETPDANSLIAVPGARSGDPERRRLFLVTHHEYDWLDTAGNDQYGKQPMTMNLAALDQDVATGRLSTIWVKNIDMAGVRGLWIPCAGTLSPWNTHLGSEEYEPDARCAENPSAKCPSTHSDPAKQRTFDDPKAFINLDGMHRYLDPSGATSPARVYDYGLVPEVTVDADGNASVVKHRALGRISRELVEVMPDRRTVYQGDDGTYNVLTMFVADRAADLSSGTLYAARWNQTASENGGAATLTWHRLGHASDREIEALVDGGVRFSDVFEVADRPADGFRTIKAGHAVGLVEHLRLKPGMEKAAAFLETRRYAAYVGATAELEKFEGVTVNAADRKLYVALTRVREGMEDRPGDPANHIRVARLHAGAVYAIDLAGGQADTEGRSIDSDFVGVAMRGLLLGEDIDKDAVGNTAAVDKIANPDNLKFSEKMRTLFIGEDSGSAHVNNFLWAYDLDSGRLSRLLSLPAGAESTGLQVVDDLNGHAYIMSNYQHAGDFSANIDPGLKATLEPMIDKYKAGVGYLEGLPGLK
jgi:secreted PhoX family phosphatase